MKEMNIRTRMWVKPIDQMDVWLDTEGYYRKHTARDGTCLFRAVSEQIFLTQAFHQEVRKQVVEYMLRNEKYFQPRVTCPLISYAEKMYNQKEWGGNLEIQAISKMYKIDIIMFEEIEIPPENVTKRGYQKRIMLCNSQERHYDSVYTKEYITTAAFCQSVLYELLYKRVFELQEVDYAVNKMLHDKTSRYQREHIPYLSTGFTLRLEMRDSYQNVKELLDFGITPFPYKVAKSLDREIYRNVEYDTWNEYRKGLRYGFCPWTCQELQVGAKCLVKFEKENYHGHVQEMSPNKGPVLVFIEELGEMRSVPFDILELLPPSSPSTLTPPKPVIPLKVHPLHLLDLKNGKKAYKYSTGGKNKPGRENEENNKNDKQIKNCVEPASPQSPVVSSTQLLEEGAHFQEEVHTYSSETIQEEPEEQMIPDSTKPDPDITPTSYNEPYRYPVYPVPTPNPPGSLSITVPPEPALVYQQPVTINLMATKSVNADGSDLPHSDIPTLRFFYNLGLDHLRMNYIVRPGAPFYINTPLIQQSFITVESPTVPSVPSYDAFHCAVQGNKRQAYEGTPLIQQCEVSSTYSPPPSHMTSYYQTPECDQYCMGYPYLDYSYDYPIYPPSPHNVIPTSYISPEGIIYQTVLTPPTVQSTSSTI